MATRMQQRRGTAAQWISTNSGNGPILNSGEIGYETDTNKFKIGDGTNHWVDLSYFSDADRTLAFTTSLTFEGATADSYETTLQVTDPTADRTITLPNASGTVALTSDIAELSQDAIDSALTAGTGITKTYDDASNTLTLAVNTSTIQARVTGVSDTEIGYLDGVTSAIQTQMDAKAPLASPALTGNATAVNLTLSGNLTVNGTTTTVNSTEINIGNAFTFEGATADAFETTLTVADPTADRAINLPDASGTVALQEFVAAAATSTDGLGWNNTTKKITVDTTYIGEVAMDAVAGAISPGAGLSKSYDDAANTITLDISSTVATKSYADTAVSTHNSSTTSVHGISNTANLVATTDTGTVTSTMIANGTIVNADINASAAIDWTKLAVSSTVSATELGYVDGVTSSIQTQLDGKQTIVSGVSDTEIGYLDGVTSAIQTQLDAKSTATKTETLTNKTLTSPVINTPTGITKSDVGLSNVDNTSDTNKPVSTATQTALNLKANLAAPTFTGTVVLPSTTSIGNVSATEIGYVDGVTSAIQTQLDAKAPIASPTFTGTVTIPAGASISGFAPLASPALTGVPTAPTAAAATNTTQVATTAFVRGEVTALVNGASAALDTLGELAAALTADEATAATLSTLVGTKAPIASPTFTGTVTIPAGASISGFAPLASPTFTGTVTLPTGTVTSTMILDGTILDADINASAAIAQSKISGLSTSLGLKANLAAPSFTGGVTVDSSGIIFTDGTQSKEGVPSRTPIIQKTASYTLTATTERDSLIEVASGSGTTITIPTNSAVAYPVGTSIDILQTSTGQVTIAGDAGVTVNATPGLKLRTQWSSATLFKRATNTWVVYGDLTA